MPPRPRSSVPTSADMIRSRFLNKLGIYDPTYIMNASIYHKARLEGMKKQRRHQQQQHYQCAPKQPKRLHQHQHVQVAELENSNSHEQTQPYDIHEDVHAVEGPQVDHTITDALIPDFIPPKLNRRDSQGSFDERIHLRSRSTSPLSSDSDGDFELDIYSSRRRSSLFHSI